jgi:hypothetical protein
MPKGAQHSPKKERLAARAALEAAARAVSIAPEYDVCVVGAGASGLMAALAAAARGARVCVLEHHLVAGKPILATGNGRCNLVNLDLAASAYNEPSFVAGVFEAALAAAAAGNLQVAPGKRVSTSAPHLLVGANAGALVTPVAALVLNAFEALGLASRAHGTMVFPVSGAAASVQTVLIEAAREAGILLATGATALALEEDASSVRVTYQRLYESAPQTLTARHVIVATGRANAALLEPLGVASAPAEPILCPLACAMGAFAKLSGVRTTATVTLKNKAGATLFQETGEVLFREYGVSGIVCMNASRAAAGATTVELNLLPGLDVPALLTALAGHTPSPALLAGVLEPSLAAALYTHAKSQLAPNANREQLIEACIHTAQHLCLPLTGLHDVAHAQVLRGGVETCEINPQTLTLTARPRVGVTGEALNVDGPCGGFNLGFAWISGLVAGAAATHEN